MPGLRLDVAVHDSPLMRIGERLRDVAKNTGRVVERDRSTAQPLAQ
jgi:hypothetical protein